MFLFGITGGIASGKSLVSGCLRDRGFQIVAADPLAKKLTRELPEIREALLARFGSEVYTSDGEINKDKLRELVFSGVETRRQVNEIIHPPVLRAIQQEAEQLHSEGEDIIGVESALVYESNMHKMLNAVVVVDAPLHRRIKWLCERDGLSAEAAHVRISAQMSAMEMLRRADYVISNASTVHRLYSKVSELVVWLHDQASLG